MDVGHTGLDLGRFADRIMGLFTGTGVAGDYMVRIRISNMYDMSTTVGKMGILGIHTPSRASLQNKYEGLFKNYKYQRLISCDVRIACASMLPADPLQIGVESGKISPADMMNPILYRAVSNDRWNTIVDRIYSGSGGVNGDTVRGLPDAFSTVSADNHSRIYYALLADDGWRKALPQQGLHMSKLHPLVYSVVNTFGNNPIATMSDSSPVSSLDTVPATAPGGSASAVSIASTIRGPARRMPRIPCMSPGGAINSNPKTFVACIILPPAQLNVLYYRLIVTWTVEFTGVTSTLDYSSLTDIENIGDQARVTTWSISAKSLEPMDDSDTAQEIGFIDTLNMDPVLVMEK